MSTSITEPTLKEKPGYFMRTKKVRYPISYCDVTCNFHSNAVTSHEWSRHVIDTCDVT